MSSSFPFQVSLVWALKQISDDKGEFVSLHEEWFNFPNVAFGNASFVCKIRPGIKSQNMSK